MVSTGAAVAVAFLPLASARSLTGRILSAVPGVRRYTQYPVLAGRRWSFRGSVFDEYAAERVRQAPEIRNVVVTLGTIPYRFDRLLARVQSILPPDAKVFWQTGKSSHGGLHGEEHRLVAPSEMIAAMRSADVVIAHAALVGLAGPAFGYWAMHAVVLVAYGALILGVFELGRQTLSVAAGVVGALLTAANLELIDRATAGFQDVPFAALWVWAAVSIARRPERGTQPLVLLAVAGLIRPEAWGFAGLYWLYLLLVVRRRQALHAILLAAAPAIWIAHDWALTGRPLFSLTGTREGAELSIVLAASERSRHSSARGSSRISRSRSLALR